MKIGHIINANDILAVMEREAKEYNFPMPDNLCHYNAGMRLTAFRNASEWLIVFEMLNYTKNHEFIDEICAYGNHIIQQGFGFVSPIVLDEVKEQPYRDENGTFLFQNSDCRMIIKDKAMRFSFTREDYERARIRKDSKCPAPAVLLRLLSSKLQDEMYLSDEELLIRTGRNNTELQMFLRLEHWHHPNLAEEELPSSSISLISLAKALETNLPEDYYCPEDSTNSDWFYWGQEHNGWE